MRMDLIQPFINAADAVFAESLQGPTRIGGVDERLDEIHSHERCSPARATGAPAAAGSSLKT
jgi:hypothetical protein